MAGYQGNDVTLATTGKNTLRNAQVRSRIEARLKEVGLSTTAILHELSAIATAPMAHFMILMREAKYDEAGNLVQPMQLRLDYPANVCALELLMKYHRMLDDREPQEVTVKALVGVDISRI
jgi:hypothetical protein